MLDYKKPSEVAQQYLDHLKTLKPEVNIAQQDSDWWVRSQVIGGVVSGIYADQRRIADDAFPQSARREALARHLDLYFGSGFRTATQARGPVKVTGTPGSTVPIGTQFQYDVNGNVYVAEETVVLTGASGVVEVLSNAAGQSQNLLEGTELTLPAPPAGIDSTAVVFGAAIGDGRNEESNEEAAARILARVRQPLAGGKVSDYQQFAFDADPSVTSANILRFPFGFGTVGVVITAGTTDIDEALNNGEPIVLIPSDDLVERVQDYIETQNPLTDCATVIKPQELPVDVTVHVRFAQGDLNTVNSGQTLTQGELVEREVKRALYKTPPGGRQFGASGFVVASEIEEVIDLNLSADPYTEGDITQIIVDRQVEDLSATGPNLMILGTQVAVPGTISVVEF